ncbi:MAG: malate dehydrogenase [Candidatus Cyclobacteriaceae bacterium M3_2C_046]
MKVSIIGLGNVGATIAYTLVLKGLVQELVLVNKEKEKARSDAFDLIHTLAFTEHTILIKAGDYEDIAGSDIVILTLSVPWQSHFTSRSDLTPGNINLFKEVLPQIVKYAPQALFMVITNPVDVMTYFTLKITGLEDHQVFGIGTLIDSARYRKYLSDLKGIHPDDIRAYILGEHGDSQFAALSIAYAGGEKIKEEAVAAEAFISSTYSAYEIVKGKGYTNFGISMAASLMIETIFLNNNRTIPVSTLIHDFWGISDVCVSVPAVIGRNGIVRWIKPDLNDAEIAAFQRSAQIVQAEINKHKQLL